MPSDFFDQPIDGLDAVIYVDAGTSARELAASVADAVGGVLHHWTVKTDRFEIDVTTNDDRPPDRVDPDDAFLFYPFVLELEFLDRTTERAEIVDAVRQVLGALDGLPLSYATAADFEDELPRNGRSESTA